MKTKTEAERKESRELGEKLLSVMALAGFAIVSALVSPTAALVAAVISAVILVYHLLTILDPDMLAFLPFALVIIVVAGALLG